MVLRPRWLGSEQFRRNYTVAISYPLTEEVSEDGEEPEWKPEWKHRPITICFIYNNSGRRYRAIVSDSELPGAHPDPDLVYERILVDWAVPDIEPDVRMLGETSRADSLQDCDVAGNDPTGDGVAVALIAAEKDRALILWGYGGLGKLARLPLEVRAKIYELTFSRLFKNRFWQCYHAREGGLNLLGITHSNPLPTICRLSTTIHDEVLHSVYREQASQITIGTEIIAANFPFQAMIQPGQEVDAAHAKIHPSKELFIGIQVGYPRKVEDAAAIRSNVERVPSPQRHRREPTAASHPSILPHQRGSLPTPILPLRL